MKKNFTPFRFSPSAASALCFFVGILAGTIWVNRMGTELQEQIGVFGQAFLGGGASRVSKGQFAELLIKRELTVGILWLTGMSLFSIPGLCLFSGWAGFSIAFLISSMTVQAGMRGIFLFLLSTFPQCILYIPVGAVLYLWAAVPDSRVHAAGFSVLFILTAAGAAAELWMNPWFMRLAEYLI